MFMNPPAQDTPCLKTGEEWAFLFWGQMMSALSLDCISCGRRLSLKRESSSVSPSRQKKRAWEVASMCFRVLLELACTSQEAHALQTGRIWQIDNNLLRPGLFDLLQARPDYLRRADQRLFA